MLRPHRKGMRWRQPGFAHIYAMSGLAPVSKPPRVIAVRLSSGGCHQAPYHGLGNQIAASRSG
jgi:hypothetical protein